MPYPDASPSQDDVDAQPASPASFAEEMPEEPAPPTSDAEAPTAPRVSPDGAGPAGVASDEVLTRLDQLALKVGNLQATFESRILRSDSEAQINAKLHAELQTYKADLYGKLLKPVLQDLITVREHILRLTAQQQDLPPENQGVSLGTFASFADDLGQILEDHDVEIHHSEPGAAYVAGLHQVVAKIESTDPAAHRRIAAVSGDGYSFQGRSLAPQRVTVFAHTANLDGE